MAACRPYGTERAYQGICRIGAKGVIIVTVATVISDPLPSKEKGVVPHGAEKRFCDHTRAFAKSTVRHIQTRTVTIGVQSEYIRALAAVDRANARIVAGKLRNIRVRHLRYFPSARR
jgi:hypothetical protein